MKPFASLPLPAEPTVVAPDGSDVRVLLGLSQGGVAHFTLAAGRVSQAVMHRTVEEIWFVLSGRGEMWRQQGTLEDIVTLAPDLCLTIPIGTRFQFRASPDEALRIVAVTMPPWPGDAEAVAGARPVDRVREPVRKRIGELDRSRCAFYLTPDW